MPQTRAHKHTHTRFKWDWKWLLKLDVVQGVLGILWRSRIGRFFCFNFAHTITSNCENQWQAKPKDVLSWISFYRKIPFAHTHLASVCEWVGVWDRECERVSVGHKILKTTKRVCIVTCLYIASVCVECLLYVCICVFLSDLRQVFVCWVRSIPERYTTQEHMGLLVPAPTTSTTGRLLLLLLLRLAERILAAVQVVQEFVQRWLTEYFAMAWNANY